MILLIDNYDSFVHNLARYLVRMGVGTRVVRNDAITLDGIRDIRPQAIIISPGPCTPTEAGISLQVVRELHAEIPMLGVCLGHQVIGAALGARVQRAVEPYHGRTSQVFHDKTGVFRDLPNPFTACRYHSLVIAERDLPSELRVTATTVDGVIMAVQHRDLPLVGVQFHPESILTSHGYELLANFLQLAGSRFDGIPAVASELPPPQVQDSPWPSSPVTF